MQPMGANIQYPVSTIQVPATAEFFKGSGESTIVMCQIITVSATVRLKLLRKSFCIRD